MNIRETYANSETVELLLKAGFDWKKYLVSHSINQPFKWEIPLYIAQQWLREVKEIRFYVTPTYYSHFNDKGEYTHESFAWYKGQCEDFDDIEACDIQGIKAGDKVDENGIKEGIKMTYEEVLEKGIQKCLKLIIEKQ